MWCAFTQVSAAHRPSNPTRPSWPANELLAKPSFDRTTSVVVCPYSDNRMSRGNRIRAIDGLRAISVAAVLAYHLELPQFAGGFLGVEVFFVISGYLITGLLIREHDAAGRIALKSFWMRRFRRLLPAVVALLLFVLVCIPFVATDAASSFPRDAVGALLYISNWWQLIFGQSYFEAALRPPLLRHLWSLAVEEQFYAVWPLVMLFLLRLRRHVAAAVAFGGAGLSALLMWVVQRGVTDTTRAYVGTDTRASGLLAGATLAFAVAAWPRLLTGRHVTSIFGVLGIAALAWAGWSLSAETTWLYPGGFLLVDAATLLAIVAAASPAAAALNGVMGNRAFVWLGTRSYGLYLFHWPVFQMMRPRVDLNGWWVNPGRIAVSLLLAELSYRLVETQFMKRSLREVRHGTQLAMGARTAVASAVVCLLIVGAAGINVGVIAARPGSIDAELALDDAGSDQTLASDEPQGGDQADLQADPQADLQDGYQDGQQPGLNDSATESDTDVDNRADSAGGADGAGVGTGGDPEVGLDSGLEVTATTTTIPPEAGTVLTIGDSVMLGAASRIKRSFGQQVTVDAEPSRSWFSVPEELERFATSAVPPKVLIIHLGNNGAPEVATLKRVIDSTRNISTVVLVTVSVPRRYEGTANARIRSVTKMRRDARIADWSALSSGHRGWFERDGFHLTPEGALAYTDLLRSTVEDLVPSVSPSAAASASPTTSTTTTSTTTLPPGASTSTSIVSTARATRPPRSTSTTVLATVLSTSTLLAPPTAPTAPTASPTLPLPTAPPVTGEPPVTAPPVSVPGDPVPTLPEPQPPPAPQPPP